MEKQLIKLNYSMSGVKMLRIFAWIIIVCNIFMGLIAIFASSAANVDTIYAIPALIGCIIIIMGIAGSFFALATIAENALIQKAIAENKYTFTNPNTPASITNHTTSISE